MIIILPIIFLLMSSCSSLENKQTEQETEQHFNRANLR